MLSLLTSWRCIVTREGEERFDKFIRTDQVGGLTRSPELIQAKFKFRHGQLSLDERRALEDEEILRAIERQRRVGIDVIVDGEMRRDAWQTDLSDAVEGFESEYPVVELKGEDGTTARIEVHSKTVLNKLHKTRHLLSESLPFLQEHAPGAFKVTMPSRVYGARASYNPERTAGAYASREELRADLVSMFIDEMKWLADEKVPYVQLDFGFAGYVIESWRDQMVTQGLDPAAELAGDIAAENQVWAALPANVIRGSHICRGNRSRTTGGRGSYDALAEQLFNELHVDRFLLEYDTERAGGFEPLRFVPHGKVVVLGLVTTKSGQLEDEAELISRIEEAAKFCPLDQLALSPQCGFDGFEESHMGVDQQWRKLELIVRTAEKVWG